MRKYQTNGLPAILLLFLAALLWTAMPAHAQGESSRKITGKVTNESGAPVSGASVTVKGTALGTATSSSGTFSLTVPAGKNILVISSIGYITREETLGPDSEITIRLQNDDSELSQVVVIGYGTVKKSDLTGSVSSIKADELKATPATSLDQALQGRAAGVLVTQNSGKPGAETSIRIRGTSSINAGNEPLYVIDGMLVNSDGDDFTTGVTRGPRLGALSSINPSDIESVEILKDASATAMYGSRGANGVVLITTKRGRSGTGIVNLEVYHGYQEVANKLKLLNAAEFGEFVNEGRLNAGKTPVYVNPKNLGAGTDWQSELFRTAPISNYQLSASGGDARTRYAVSASYFDQDGIIINSDFKRYSFRANLDREVSKKLSVGTNLSYSRVTSKGVLTNAGTIVPGVVTGALLFNPALSVYDSTREGGYTYENTYHLIPGRTLGNPVAEAREYISNTVISRILGNAYARYAITPNLELKTSFGIDAFSSDEGSFGPKFLKRAEASLGEASLGKADGLSWLSETTLTYDNTFNSKHKINALLGYTMQEFNDDKLFVYAFGFTDSRLGYHNIGTASSPQKPANSESSWSMLSYLGRINYTYNDKYLLTLTGRIDGSSKFGAGNKYGFFPSGALAWRLSDEEFMKNVSSVNDMKLRVSYGLIGNQSILPYQSLPLVGPYGEGSFNSSQGSEVYTGQEPVSYANENLKWESTRQLDIGLDFSLFARRVSITADYYHKKTFDLLLSVPIPTTSGFETTVLNVGNIANKGFDLDVRTVNTRGTVSWNSAITFSVNRNKITNLNSDNDILLDGGIILREGESIGTFYGYIFDGIFQTDAEAASSPVLEGQQQGSSDPASWAKAGDRRYRNLTNDNKITAEDRTILGSAQPDFTWGFNNNLSYKNFDLSFFFQGSQGNKLANFNNLNLLNFTGENNVLAEAALNRWTPERHSNKYPRALSAGSKDAGIFSSAIVEDASYVRLKNITLSYNLTANILKRLRIQQIRIYASATNLWTLTDYSGYDPEANTYGQNTTLVGVDNGGYPQSKVYLLGLNIGF